MSALLSRLMCWLGWHLYDVAAVNRRARRMARQGVDMRRVGRVEAICPKCGEKFAVRL